LAQEVIFLTHCPTTSGTRHKAPSHGKAIIGTYPFSASLTDGQANLTDLLPRLKTARERRHPVSAVNTAGWRGLIRTPRESCNLLQTASENKTFNQPIGRALTQPDGLTTDPKTSDQVGDSDAWWLKGGERETMDACCMEKSTLVAEKKIIHHACPGGFVAPTTPGEWPLCSGLLPAANDVKCVVVSFGVAGEWAFETAMAAFPHRCRVHMFDPTTATKKRNEQTVPPGVTFHHGGLRCVRDPLAYIHLPRILVIMTSMFTYALSILNLPPLAAATSLLAAHGTYGTVRRISRNLVGLSGLPASAFASEYCLSVGWSIYP
jgi:hypothetical protein